MNGAATNSSANSESVSGSLSDFVGDLAELGELQLKLLAHDARVSLEETRPSLLGLGLGLCVIVSGVFLSLYGLAEELTARGVLSRPGAFVTVGFGGVLMGAVASRISLGRLASSSKCFRSSTEELVRNLAWVRTVLTESGRARPRRW